MSSFANDRGPHDPFTPTQTGRHGMIEAQLNQGWEDLSPPLRNEVETMPVRVGMIAFKGSAPRMEVVIRHDVLHQLGTGEHRYRLTLGAASSHIELLRITIDDTSDHRKTFRANPLKGRHSQGTQFYRFLLRPHHRFPITTGRLQECAHEIKTKAILVTLPRWSYDREAREEFEAAGARRASRKAVRS